jgi:ribosomal protein S18 acetylase RimI-like enzyme
MNAVDVPDALLGRRVALRHRLHGDLLTDAVGDLFAAGDDVVVHTRRGPVRVARSAVVAVRAIPPPVPRRPSWAAVSRLEQLCADAWPARVDRPLGEWRLRAAGGFTGRANAALALGDPGLPLPAALEAVRAFAAGHGVPPRVHVPVGSRWDRAVAEAGWVLDSGHEAGAEVAVLVADVDTLADAHERRVGDGSGHGSRVRRPIGDHAVEMPGRPSAAWWDLSLGREPSPDERGVLDPGPPLPTAFGLVAGAGVVRAAVVDDHVHLSRLAVTPAARRRGVATRLTVAAAAWGRANGARWAVLQVALHNVAARAFYDSLGATEHHRYRYLVPPG